MSDYIPFPPGTVRGPYHRGGFGEVYVTYMVQTKGGWVPFTRDIKDQKECEESARKFAEQYKNAKTSK